MALKLFEVVFGDTAEELGLDNEDTCFLVRAHDYKAAMEDVLRNCTSALEKLHPNSRKPWIILEIGVDSAIYPHVQPQILRGPYAQHAFNFGWKCWKRKIVGSEYVDEWEEDRENRTAGYPIE